MVTIKNAPQYRALQKKRMQILQDGKRRGPKTSARYLALQLRATAPIGRGDLVRNIRLNGSKVSASGTNKYTGFPYIHWINATPGFPYQKVAYLKKWRGDDTKYSYAEAARPGNKRGYMFYQKGLAKAANHFRNAMITTTHKTWTAQF